MPGVSREQVERARELDLLSYLQAYEPHELKRDGPGRYTTITHDSLVISNGKWVWNGGGGIGGVSALDYLLKVRNMGFVEAVEHLTGESAASARSYQEAAKKLPPPQKRPFTLPEASRYATHAVSYLQSRGISPETINRCIQAGILYESRKYQNVVFVGKDDTGTARFACMRGTRDDFRIDAAGSDKRFSFCIPAKNPDSKHLILFEAPIDALSHATLQQRGAWDWDGVRLSLGGTSPVAVIAYLERNPQITRVILHLDNDRAGLIAARKIKTALAADRRFAHIRVSVNPARGGKDYNDVLLHAIKLEREQKQQCRRKAAILI